MTSPTDSVVIREYDPAWPYQFEQLMARIVKAMGDVPVTVEHVGSTAVPGLAAKPIIDLDVVVRSPDDVPVATGRLASIGSQHEGERGVPGREAFHWPVGEVRHHLYLVVEGSPPHRQHLAFRDYLRTHPEVAVKYADLKRELASKHVADRNAYTEAKGAFIERVLDQAGRTMAIPRRVYIIGGPGAGKSTIAKQLAQQTGALVFNLDNHFWKSGGPKSAEERQAEMANIMAHESWIAEGAYTDWADDLIQQADVVLWVEVPLLIAVWRIVTRHTRVSLSGNNSHPGVWRLLKFIWRTVQYHLSEQMAGASATGTRRSTGRYLVRHHDKVVGPTPRDVRAWMAELGPLEAGGSQNQAEG